MSNMSLQRLFFSLCERIQTGALQVQTPDGNTIVFGDGEPKADIQIRDWSFVSAVIRRGDVGLGESYVQGLWDSSDVAALLELVLRNASLSQQVSGGKRLQRMMFRFVDGVVRRNNRLGSRRNIHAHYDVGNEFYSLWLDPSMTYSSALFEQSGVSLEDAQQKKYERLLSLLPDDAGRLLEIGCGWGGFAERAARDGREVTGVTISKAQQDYAQRRLGGKADVRLQDYRDIEGKFDSVVSIEMIEAVGERYWPHYFGKIKQCLAEGGRAALQVILIADESFSRYRKQSDFIRQYTFPGGMLVPPMKISECAEAVGLGIDTFHRFGQDYARTLRSWLSRFNEAEKKIRALGHGDEFIRSWRYYFEFCAAGFSHGKHIDVAQISLSHR